MISFIVPIFNAEKYLVRCVHSIQAQILPDYELLLIDDGSTDDSLALAQKLAERDDRIVVLSQTHAGQSAARNNGMEHANGEYIAFVDADDAIDPDWSTMHLKAIDSVDYVQSGHPRNKYQYTVVWNRLYKRSAVEHIRFPEGMIYEDVLWSVDLWLSGATCRIIDYDGYHYTVNPNSTTSRSHPEAQKAVIRELKKRLHGTSLKCKAIVLYTILRLKFHFMQS